ncbi:MAG: hypothetical protein KAI73_11760 [Rhodospirillaceae bacterium]|nr:hypothetical protein [Rhodospirillaceae bacterium]
MGSNVEEFPGVTRLNKDPDSILQGAIGKMETVIVIGYTKEGEDEYFASSCADGGEALWHLMRAQKKLLDIVDK